MHKEGQRLPFQRLPLIQVCVELYINTLNVFTRHFYQSSDHKGVPAIGLCVVLSYVDPRPILCLIRHHLSIGLQTIRESRPLDSFCCDFISDPT